MERYALFPAHRLYLGLGLTRHQHTFVAWGRLGALHHLQPLVHLFLELVHRGEGVDAVGCDVVAEVGPSGDRPVSHSSEQSGHDIHHAG